MVLSQILGISVHTFPVSGLSPLSPPFLPLCTLRNNGKIRRRLATLSGNMPPMDVAGVIWMTVFGIVIGAAVLAGGIFIYRFIRAYWDADRD